MIHNPHILILSLGLVLAICIGAYWAGRVWYMNEKAEQEKALEVLRGLQKPTWKQGDN